MPNAAQSIHSCRHAPQRIRGSSTEVLEAALRMRREPTSSETRLWAAIRGRQLDGLHFRRQHPIGRFILDFCCTGKRLAVELDGAVHVDRQGYDQARSEYLASFGYRVLRYSNEETMKRLSAVLERIKIEARAAHTASCVSPAPTPQPAPPTRPGEGEKGQAHSKIDN